MKNAVIVGGGIAGLYSALFLSRRSFNVTLIEGSPDLGGLLKSVDTDEGFSFDCGAHFLRDTGIREIDEEIFYPLSKNWQRLPFLKIGTYFNNKFYNSSPFISAAFLPEHEYQKGLTEMLSLPPDYDYKSAYDYLMKRYGPTFTEKIYRESVEKFFSEKIENLAWLAPRFYDLIRVICLSPEATREIKKSKWFDDRIGYHHYTEGLAGLNNYYPSTGGIGQFIHFFKELLIKNGVTIRTQDSVEKIDYNNGVVNRMTLKSGTQIEVDHLVWTLPIPLLNKASGVAYDNPKMKFKASVLIDLACDKPFNTDVFYAVCYMQKYKSFRIFFYPNANSTLQVPGQYSTCVEVISDFDKVNEVDPLEIFKELQEMNFVQSEAKCTYHNKRNEAAGFPVYSNEFVREAEKMRQFAADAYKNVSLVGKSNGKVFFMNDTLVDTYKTLKSFCGEPLT